VIQRVLINGLSNAIKFSKDRPVVIKLSLRDLEKQLVLEITDAGDGIPAHSREKLFKPFVKNDDSVPGAGLGLHISRQLVERMSGSLDLDSEVGRGSTFRVLLPCGNHVPVSRTGQVKREIVTPPVPGGSRLPTISTSKSKASQSGRRDYGSEASLTPEMSTPSSSIDAGSLDSSSFTPGQKRPSPSLPTDSDHSISDISPQSVCNNMKTTSAVETFQSLMKVLIVDDNEICRKLLRAGLKRSPIANTVLEAANGQEAVQVYKEKRPDLVITDISMPVMDGVTAAGLMREADLILKTASQTALASTSEHDTVAPRLDISPARIYALTGLGSSDPRLKATALTGFAGLDGWLIKGKANMDAINQIMTEMDQEQNEMENVATNSFTKKRCFNTICDPIKKLSIKE
jgi:CheY-like chemotaxis protein